MTIALPDAVIFDLDGTLVDTAPDLTAALNHVLAREGRRMVSEDAVRHMVGHGARHLIVEGMKATGAPVIDAELERLLQVFLAYYSNHIADKSQPFPGVREVLADLAGNRTRLGVCTNKPERLTRELLGRLELDRIFGVIVGGDTLAVRKPDPAHVLATISGLDADPARSVMVGDSINDVAAAKAAGVSVVAVSFGYSDRPASALGADLVIDHFAALPPALRRLMAP